MNDPNCVGVYCLSRLASSFTDRILTGEGADELFFGNPRHLLIKYVPQVRPKIFKKALICLLHNSNHSKAQKLRIALGQEEDELIACNCSVVSYDLIRQLLSTKDVVLGGLRKRLNMVEGLETGEALERLCHYEMKTYLPGTLERLDRMSLAGGNMAVTPFLDDDLVDFALALLPSYNLRGLTPKYLLREIAKKYLNKSLIHKPKSGFGIPLSAWFADDQGLGRYLRDIADGGFALKDYFDQSKIKSIISAHQQGLEDHGEVLWVLINLHLWYLQYLK